VSVAVFAVKAAVSAVAGRKAVQQTVAFQATETVLVVPKTRSCDHFFRLKNFSVTFWTAINVSLFSFNDPSLNGGPSQNVVLLNKHLGHRSAECSGSGL